MRIAWYVVPGQTHLQPRMVPDLELRECPDCGTFSELAHDEVTCQECFEKSKQTEKHSEVA